jgi:hypothetical protein
MGNASQGRLTVDGSPKIGTRGLSLCQVGFTRSELVLACLARGLALTNQPVLYCIGHGALASEKQRGMGIVIGQLGASLIQTGPKVQPDLLTHFAPLSHQNHYDILRAPLILIFLFAPYDLLFFLSRLWRPHILLHLFLTAPRPTPRTIITASVQGHNSSSVGVFREPTYRGSCHRPPNTNG